MRNFLRSLFRRKPNFRKYTFAHTPEWALGEVKQVFINDTEEWIDQNLTGSKRKHAKQRLVKEVANRADILFHYIGNYDPALMARGFRTAILPHHQSIQLDLHLRKTIDKARELRNKAIYLDQLLYAKGYHPVSTEKIQIIRESAHPIDIENHEVIRKIDDTVKQVQQTFPNATLYDQNRAIKYTFEGKPIGWITEKLTPKTETTPAASIASEPTKSRSGAENGTSEKQKILETLETLGGSPETNLETAKRVLHLHRTVMPMEEIFEKILKSRKPPHIVVDELYSKKEQAKPSDNRNNGENKVHDIPLQTTSESLKDILDRLTQDDARMSNEDHQTLSKLLSQNNIPKGHIDNVLEHNLLFKITNRSKGSGTHATNINGLVGRLPPQHRARGRIVLQKLIRDGKVHPRGSNNAERMALNISRELLPKYSNK